MKLPSASAGIPLALEFWQVSSNFVEGHSIATIVGARGPERKVAVWKFLGHDLSDFSHRIVMSGVANVEDFSVNGGSWSFEGRNDRAGNVQTVDKRPPRRSIAHYANFSGRPSK